MSNGQWFSSMLFYLYYKQSGADRDVDNDDSLDHNFGGSDFDVDTVWSWHDY